MAMIFGLSIAHLLGCAPTTGMKTSDHFNGRKFHNPTMAEEYSPGFSDVFRMMREGRPDWPEHVENVGVPRLNENLGPGDVALTFVNHATFLIQFPGLNILTDPVWSDRVGPISWLGLRRVRAPGVKLEDLPRIDLIVISHNHYDHLDESTIAGLTAAGQRPRYLVPLGVGAWFTERGIANVTEMDWWDSIDLGPLRVHFTPSQHWSKRSPFDTNATLWGGFALEVGTGSPTWRFLYTGDTGYSADFREIRRRLGPVDYLAVPIGAYLPRDFMRPQHVNPDDAVQIAVDVEAKAGIGVHWGTFELTQEAFDAPPRDLAAALGARRLPADRLAAFRHGETRVIGPDDDPEFLRRLGS